ncbi:Ig-like domain-containing protein [Streptomyces sp. NPDC002896]|uniref:Ig-like domain-containing protein n=1 Tax=Streptomyces sp. NPDC002896 TaxID=3154438 RepID=UPI0033197C0E
MAFAGTGEAGSTVSLTDGGSTVCTAMVDAAAVACTPATSLADGEHTITPTATDGAGNTADGEPVRITIDITGPKAKAAGDALLRPNADARYRGLAGCYFGHRRRQAGSVGAALLDRQHWPGWRLGPVVWIIW